MKKTMAYVAVAVFLGFAIMLLPLTLETGSPLHGLQPQSYTNTNNAKPSTDGNYYGSARQPLNFLPPSLVLIAGLVVSMTVYVLFKRSISRRL